MALAKSTASDHDEELADLGRFGYDEPPEDGLQGLADRQKPMPKW